MPYVLYFVMPLNWNSFLKKLCYSKNTYTFLHTDRKSIPIAGIPQLLFSLFRKISYCKNTTLLQATTWSIHTLIWRADHMIVLLIDSLLFDHFLMTHLYILREECDCDSPIDTVNPNESYLILWMGSSLWGGSDNRLILMAYTHIRARRVG